MVCTCALAFLWSTASRRCYSRSSARCERLLLDSDFFLMRPCILPWPYCSQRVARGGLGCCGKTDLPRSPTATSRGATSPNNAPFSSFWLELVRGIESFTSAALAGLEGGVRLSRSIASNPWRRRSLGTSRVVLRYHALELRHQSSSGTAPEPLASSSAAISVREDALRKIP